MARKELLFELLTQNQQDADAASPAGPENPDRQGVGADQSAVGTDGRPAAESAVRTEQPPASRPTAPTGEGAAEAVVSAEREAEAVRQIPINYYTISISIVVVLLMFFCGFVLGRRTVLSAASQQSDRRFEEIRQAGAEPEVMDVNRRGGSGVMPRRDGGRSGPGPARNLPGTNAEGEKITRKAGLNYLIIESFLSVAQAERAQTFLSENGIGATLERSGNRILLKSTVGFDFATQKAEKDAFQRQIKALGRRYVRQPGTEGHDFQTCYYAKEE